MVKLADVEVFSSAVGPVLVSLGASVERLGCTNVSMSARAEGLEFMGVMR